LVGVSGEGTVCHPFDEYYGRANYRSVIERLRLRQRLERTKVELARCQNQNYLNDLLGTIGTDPSIHR
jgi:hypothetical protein